MEPDRFEGDGWKWGSVPAGCGVIAIRRIIDGKAYFLAITDMRQRAYDAVKLLRAGKHHNRELQAAWTAAADEFEVVAVEAVRQPYLLAAFKQAWIERLGDNCFNKKNSIPVARVLTPSRR